MKQTQALGLPSSTTLMRRWHFQTCCCLIAMISALCLRVSAQVPDLTAGGTPGDSEYINLGPTGMEGWIYNGGSGNLNETGNARQILVTKVDAGSPANGILAAGDVILGASGTGLDPVNFTSDARKALAYAIDAAEGNNPAALKLIRWRSGVSTNVSITLEYLGGSYTSTAPYNCPKSAAILEKGVEHIMNFVTDTGFAGFAPTVLMAANNTSNPKNAVRQARAKTEIYQLNLTQQEINDMTSGDLARAIGKPWNIGPSLIAQAEYYLQTGDSAVLPSIRARAIQIANAQSLFGTMGHHYSLPGPNGEINGPYGIGYGPVNNAGLPCFLGLVLAGKCGLTDQEILDGISRAGKYYQYYADLGTVPYGENKETGSITNNGKSGLSALALGMVNGYETQTKYFTKLSVFGADERDSGHTGPYFNQLWTPLASNLGGQDALARYFNQTSWLYDLCRRWDGSFVYQPYYQDGGISVYGRGHKASWTTLLTYAAPLAQLRITGKNVNPALALNATDIADINHAIGYNPTTRTTNQLLQDLASPLPQLHWSAGAEIGANRTADHAAILPTLINMAQNGATYAERHGAIYALNKIANDSTAAVLSGLLMSTNSKVRYMAANALKNLSMTAKTAQAAAIVNALVAADRPILPLDPENPMHVDKQAFGQLLFDANVGIWGGSRVTGADRALLYPAFRIISTAPMGGTRDTAFSVAAYLTKADVENLAEVLVQVATGPPPGEITYANRFGAITAMQVNGFAEGVPASVIAFNDMTKSNENVLALLEAYAGSVLTVKPDPKIIDFCELLMSNSDEYDEQVQAVLDAIAADQLPEQLTPFKSVDWVFADAPSLALPNKSTVLRVRSSDFAKGIASYKWRKVHGAGEVSFTPNGTGAAKNTTVVFDGVPGIYTFEVTMSDDKGLTEATKSVTMTLYGTGGTLPSNTAPTANPQSITVGQGTPTQVVLTGADPESQSLVFTVENGPNHGSLSGVAPHLVYTADAAYTGTDSFTFVTMDTEGLTSTATVSITVDPLGNVGVAVYEPFDYPTGLFNGSASANEIGLAGTWTANSAMNIIGGSLNYGSLVTEGGSINNLTLSNSFGGSREIKPTALAANNLLADGATLWFSAVIGYSGSSYHQQTYLALANDRFSANSNSHHINNDGAQLGSGVGVAIDGGQALAAQFRDASQGSAANGQVYGTWTDSHGSMASFSHRLVVGKITWGAASDTIEIYLPKENLVLPSSPSSSLTVSVDQSTYDTLTFSRNSTPLLDEIRFGATLQSVLQGTAPMSADVTAPTPDPMTFASAPSPSGPASITMTATPAHDALEVEYRFTCTAGGGNDSSWQTSNVYTDSGLTPGVQYSYTVKARDKFPGQNETAASAAASATIPALATVPDVVGILQSSAEDLVEAANLTVGSITTASTYSLTVPAGHVLSQSPAGDVAAAYESAVNLEISIGQDPELPTLAAVDIVDNQAGGPVVTNTLMTYTLSFSEDMNAATLKATDFVNAGSAAITIGSITEISPGVVNVQVTPTSTGILRLAVAGGSVILDARGDALNTTRAIIDDTVITINLPNVVVPNVVGMTRTAAESAIVAANLVVGSVYSIYDETVAAGAVISQNPASGSNLPGQYPVNMVISLGTPPDTTGPVIVTLDPADAAYNVEVNAAFKMHFNEPVFVNTGNITIRNLNDGTDMIIPVGDASQVLAYANILTITPAVNLHAGNSYAVRIPAGAVVDASGNRYAGISDNTTWNFSTALSPLANILFTESFETPNVTTYTQGSTPTTWVRASQGFNTSLHGLIDKAGGAFTVPDPNHQGYAFRYGSTGITTAEGVIGTIAADTTYEVSFDVIRDGTSGGTAYSVRMLAFAAGAVRNDCRSNGTGIQLATLAGNSTTDGNLSRVTFQTTVAAGNSAIGRDFAFRFIGSGSSAIVDNVRVRTISPSAPDQVPPAIASLTPADDSQVVSLTKNLKIVFDEDIAIGGGSITIKDLTTGAKTVINAIDGVRVLVNGPSLEINPTEDLNTNTFYSVRITPGAITDLSGNGFPGINDDISWTFNTGQTDDTTAPGVLALSPADGATSVSYRASLSLTFNENVVASSGNITLRNLNDATETVINVNDSSRVTVAGPNVVITPATYMGEGKNYAVRMSAGAILDLSGNPFAGIADDVTWNFTTSANNPPAVLALSPADESVHVNISNPMSVTFDESITAGSGYITIRNVNTSGNLRISINDGSQVSISGPVLTINPNSDLGEATNYAVLIDPGAILDLGGNVFAGITSDASWNFVTGVSSVGLAFSDDFEVSSGSPDVDASGSAGNTSKQTGPNWVRASVAFGAANHGIVDESSAQFTDPGGEQAYAFRYTNSGITTKEAMIGTLTAGKSYRVSFNVVGDGHDNGGAYDVGLVTFAPGASRADVFSMSNGTSRVLATKSGNYSGPAYQLVSFLYTSNGIADSAVQGHDLAIRLKGASFSANIDNVQITINDSIIDVTPPTLASGNIVDDKVGGPVEINTLVTYTLGFSEDMDAATVSAADFANAGTSAVTIGAISEVVPGVFTVQVTPNTAGSLVLSVPAGAVLKDVAGNSMVTTSAIADDTTITVNDPPDLVNPTLVSVSPQNGATDVLAGSNLTATFSEPITKGVGNITLKNLTDATNTVINVTSGEVSASGSVLTINPAGNLLSGKNYAVWIDAGAVRDLAANAYAGINNNATWSFTAEVLPYAWTQTVGGAQSWTTGTNWLGGFAPDPVSGDSVDFSTVNIAANTTLTLGANRTARIWKFGDTSGTQTWTVNSGNTMILAGTTPNIHATTNTTLNNVVGGTQGILKTGSSTLTLANTANTFTGGVVVDQGNLTVNTDGSLGGTGGIAFNASGTLTVSTSGQTLNRSLALNNNALVNLSMGGTATISGTVTGNGGIICPNTLTLGSTANTFTGPITMGGAVTGVTLTVNSLGDSSDSIYLGSQDNYGSSTFIYGTGASAPITFNQRPFVIGGQARSGSFDYSATIKNNNATAGNTMTINSNMIIGGVASVNNRRLILAGTNTGENKLNGLFGNGIDTLASEISSLAKFEAGTWAVTGANTYTGSVTIKAGKLIVNSLADAGVASPLGASDDSSGMGLLLYGGTLQYAPVAGAGAIGHSTNRNFLIATSSTIDASGSGALQFTRTGDVSPDLSGQTITTTSGSGFVTVASTAGLAEGMTVKYNGAASSGVIGSINSATQFQLTANATGVGTFNDATFGYPAARTLTLTGSSTAANSITGNLRNSTASGNGVLSLTKSGTGTWALNGANAHTGATTINDGTLLINGNSASATGAVAVNNTATLGGGGTIGGTVTVAASAKVAPGNSVGLLAINGGFNISAMAGGAGTINCELGNIGASDRIAVGGTLTIGTAALGFEDFVFTNAGDLQNGNYTLISYATLSGTLKAGAALTGPVGTGTGTLQISGNSIQLVVSGVTVADTTPPTLPPTAIVNNVSGGVVQSGNVVTYTVTFSEDIDAATVSSADFGNAGTSAITIGTITEGSPGVFTIPVVPTTGGSLRFQVNAGAVITDVAGNALNTTTAITDNTTIVVNTAPVWSGNPVNEVDATEDSVYSATLADNANDGNGDTLAFTKTSGPAWLTVATNGELSGTPSNSDVGGNSFTVSVSDGSAAPVTATLNIAVLNTNDAPVWNTNPITGGNATEDAAYSGTIAGGATDVDAGASQAYAKVSGPAWLNVASNGALSGTPTNSDVGTNTFTVSVSDSIAAAVTATLYITVDNVNDAPVWASNPVNGPDATEDSAYSATLTGSASDVDAGSSLTFTKISGPAWLSVAGNGTISGTPTNSDAGANSFTVSVSDSIADPVTATLNITVINVNDAPVWAANPIAGAAGTQDVAYSGSLAGSASDVDAGAVLAFAKVSGPAWLNVSSSGALSGKPTNASAGSNVFTVSVSDGIAAPVTVGLNITVINVNDAPVWAGNPVSAADATEDAAYSGTLLGRASDADADPGATLSFTKLSGPAWLTVDSGGALSGTPANGDVGSNMFTVSVSDGTAAPVTAWLAINVTNTNDAPAWATSPVTARDATIGSAYNASITGAASDPDAGANLTFAKVSGPAWLTVAANGTLSGSPAGGNAGSNVFTVSVSDGIATAVTATINIIVRTAPPAVVLADNFEPGANAFGGTTQDVTNYAAGNTSQQANTTLWVRATSGFGANRNGLVDETENSGANFTDPAGTQAYAFRYTNSGVTTAAGKVGALTSGTVINVSFDVVRDGFNGGLAYDALLVLFNSGAARSGVEFADKDTAAVLARVAGSAPTNGSYQRINLSYTVGDSVVDNNGATSGVSTTFLSSLLGKDIALRFDGATDSANIDNVEITVGSSILDTTPPSIAGWNIVDDRGGAPVVVNSPVNYTLTFSEDIDASTVTTSDLGNAGTSPVTIGTVAETTPGVFVVAVTPTATGTLRLQVNAGAEVSDAAGNPFVATQAITDNTIITVESNTTTVPSLVGLTQSSATLQIAAASLTTGSVGSVHSNTVPAGRVISQGLSSGSSVPRNSAVDLVVSLGIANTPKLVRTNVTAVGSTAWTTVSLGHIYQSPVIIATPIQPPGVTIPVVTRIANVTSTGFDIKLSRADGLTDPVNLDVSVIVVDEGIYTQAQHGVKMEAVKFNSTLTARKGSWVAEARSYQNSYTAPVVIGQVMSTNDPNWSAFWSMGSTRSDPAGPTQLNLGKHVGEDPNTTRANETLGYIVIESGVATIDGIACEAGVGPATVQGFGDSAAPYSYALGGTLTSAGAAAVSQTGMIGDDGSWAVLSGASPVTTGSLGLHVVEDQALDNEQSHPAERVNYVVFE